MTAKLHTSASGKRREWMSTRDVLWYIVFAGFAVNYMLRVNLNIAIISMIRQKPRPVVTTQAECVGTDTLSSLLSNITDENTIVTSSDSSSLFDWNEHQQGIVLGAYYWLQWTMMIPGGILAAKFGTKLVFGLANFMGVLCCFMIPAAAAMGAEYLVLIRVLQGFSMGFAWPAMHHLTAVWIPPNERSEFVSAYSGASIGAAFTFPLCGLIIDQWGWELVFYVCGVLGTVWYAAWYVLVYDSPAEHPRISPQERDYIVKSLGRTISKEKGPVPWRSIFTSRPVWLNILAQWGGIWGLFTAMTHAPTYFNFIHGWNIQATGLLSGMPHLMRMVFAYAVSRCGDYLLKAEIMSRTNVRKIAVFIACVVHGMCFLALAYSGCNSVAAIIFLTAATTVHGAISTGTLASFVDLSPNFAGITLGLSGTVTAALRFICPLVVGYLTFNNQTVGQWQKVFWICAGMLVVPGVLYSLFATSDLQDWNTPSTENGRATDTELATLKSNEKAGNEVHECCKKNGKI